MEKEKDTKKQGRLIKWLKRIGFWGFIFFLIKGLLWLAFFYWLGKK